MSSMGDTDTNAFPSCETPLGTVGSQIEPEVHPTKKRPYKLKSDVWEHYTKIKFDKSGKATHAKCNYCATEYICSSANGTSTLRNHVMNKCPKYPYNNVNKRQKQLSFPSVGGGGSSQLIAWSFDQKASRIALAKMIIMDELPFKFIEREGFRIFMNTVQPDFKIVSRTTVVKDCLNIYVQEKKKLKNLLVNSNQRVCLTTDLWTSLQNTSYICLTAHFIDHNWTLHKRILNFREISSHKGKEIGKAIELCLLEWRIQKIGTLTVDNASANDVAAGYLRNKLVKKNALVLDGEFFHVRCSAHILNLIVKDGIDEIGDSVSRIRGAVKYARSSPTRAAQFRACIEQERITSKMSLVLDVPTRWNSTYLMLDTALKFQKAFERLDEQDSYFQTEVSLGVPNEFDWDNARVLTKFLKRFYDATLRLSGCLHATSNCYFDEVVTIENSLADWAKNSDSCLRLMAMRMKEKYDKYWGNIEKINIMVLMAIVFDPRYKLRYVKWCYKQLYAFDKVEHMMQRLIETMKKMFEEYKGLYPNSANNKNSNQNEMEVDQPDSEVVDDDKECFKAKFLRQLEEEENVECKSELDRYLEDPSEKNGKDFDILLWWKVNAPKYSILSQMARDVLAIPVSTVASESAFSTGGRVLDQFRSSLTEKVVECLICTQDWFRAPPVSFDNEEKLSDLEEIVTSVITENPDLVGGA